MFLLLCIIAVLLLILVLQNSKSKDHFISNPDSQVKELLNQCQTPCSDRDNDPVACCQCIANMDLGSGSYEKKYRKCMCKLANQGDFCFNQSTNFLLGY